MSICRRHSEWLANVAKLDNENDKNSRKKRSTTNDKQQLNVRHHIILIRHGQYNTNGKTDSDRILTTLGWYLSCYIYIIMSYILIFYNFINVLNFVIYCVKIYVTKADNRLKQQEKDYRN